MKIPHDMLLVPGDIVSLTARVSLATGPGEGRIYVEIGGEYGRATSIDRDDAALASTTIRVGDEVRAVEAFGSGATKDWPFGIAAAVVGDKAWIEWPSGPSIETAGNLRRTRTAQQVHDNDPRPGESAALAAAE